MKWLYTLHLKLRSLFRRDRVEHDLNDELQYHLERQIEQNIASGMAAEEARYAALRAMRGIEQRKEECRDARGLNFLDNLIQDLRYAFRTLRLNPGFTTIAVITLALGIGGVATIFSVVNGVLLRPLPYNDADRLIFVSVGYTVASGTSYTPPPLGSDWPSRVRLFDGLTPVSPATFTIPDSESPLVSVARVSTDYFSIIGAKPAIGRDFVDQEATEQPTAAILSHPFWQERFGGDPNVLGKTVKFSEATLRIVGVMPPRFRAPFFTQVAVWTAVPKPANSDLWFGRMKAGFTAAQVEAGLAGILKQVGSEFPASADRAITVRELLPGTATNSPLLLILFGSVAFILLMAVINVANLMLSRTLTRHREIAIRAAIGAGRRRLIRQLLTESLLLSSIGGLLGLVAGYAGMRLIVRTIPPTFPRIHEIDMDPIVVAFVLGITFLTAIGFGIIPAFAGSRADLQLPLKESTRNTSASRRNRGLRQALVAAEIALATLLLIAAALTGKSFWNLMNVPLGMEIDNVVAADIRVPQGRYRTEAERAALYSDVVERVKRYPEVDSVTLIRTMPVGSSFRVPLLMLEGASTKPERTITFEVTSDYFRTLSMPLINGRPFRDDEPAAVINDTLAAQYWPASNPIGNRIKVGGVDIDRAPWLTIVGVVRDEGIFEFGGRRAQVFIRCGQCSTMLVKRRPPASNIGNIGSTIRRELAAIDPNLLVTQIRTMDEELSANYRVVDSRFRLTLFFAFAGAGLLLAFAGVYGVTSYSAAQRTQEVGVRIALGATRWNVLLMMMHQCLIPVAIGITAGWLGASALTGLLKSYLFEVTPTDPAVFITAPALLAVTALVANFIPARRSTRIDPMAALKYE